MQRLSPRATRRGSAAAADVDKGQHLAVNECVGCEARYFDRRNACAKCGKEEFRSVRVADDATLRSFSVVYRAAPGIPVPYVSAIVLTDDGTSVRANVVGLDDPMKAELGMRLRFTTFSCGTDDNLALINI